MIATFTLCSKRALSDVLEGFILKEFSFNISKVTCLQLKRSYKVYFYYHLSVLENLFSGMNSVSEKYTFGINQMRIVGKDDGISYIYCRNGII